MEKAIALFSKPPQPGQTKSRLWEALTPEASALFHRACLEDLTRAIKGLDAAAYLYWTGKHKEEFSGPFLGSVPGDFKELDHLSLDGFSFRQQQGGDLGQRLVNAFRELLINHRRVIIIGSDQPELSGQDLEEALELLLHHDLVLGPTLDGGYYLIGLKQLYPELFRDIAWSTEKVYRQTRDKAEQKGLTVATLPVRQDIDTYEDLIAFHDRQHTGPASQLTSFKLAHYYLHEK